LTACTFPEELEREFEFLERFVHSKVYTIYTRRDIYLDAFIDVSINRFQLTIRISTIKQSHGRALLRRFRSEINSDNERDGKWSRMSRLNWRSVAHSRSKFQSRLSLYDNAFNYRYDFQIHRNRVTLPVPSRLDGIFACKSISYFFSEREWTFASVTLTRARSRSRKASNNRVSE
jgi:hypothetical protein